MNVLIPDWLFMALLLGFGVMFIFVAIALSYGPAWYFFKRAILRRRSPVAFLITPHKSIIMKDAKVDMDILNIKAGKKELTYKIRPSSVYSFSGGKAVFLWAMRVPALIWEKLVWDKVGSDPKPPEIVQLDPKEWEDDLEAYNDARAFQILENMKFLVGARLGRWQTLDIVKMAIAGVVIIIGLLVAYLVLSGGGGPSLIPHFIIRVLR